MYIDPLFTLGYAFIRNIYSYIQYRGRKFYQNSVVIFLLYDVAHFAERGYRLPACFQLARSGHAVTAAVHLHRGLNDLRIQE